MDSRLYTIFSSIIFSSSTPVYIRPSFPDSQKPGGKKTLFHLKLPNKFFSSKVRQGKS